MGNPGGETPDPREQARSVFIDTLVSEGVTLACTAVLFAVVYWRADLVRLAGRLAGLLPGQQLRPDVIAGYALTLADFRAEVCEIDHAPQHPGTVV